MILAVGGSFNPEGGKESGLFKKLVNELKNEYDSFYTVNGGTIDDLHKALTIVEDADIVIWFANVPNNIIDNVLHKIKEINRKVILITSKRNNDEYSFLEMVSHALGVKANLTLSFTRVDDKFKMMLFDPLGNVWAEGFDVSDIAPAMYRRAIDLMCFTRQGTKYDKGDITIPNDEEFFSYIRESAIKFKELIPAPTTRFLGNASFRCTEGGFPSMKKEGQIYVSKRNIDKKEIGIEGFVPVEYRDCDVYYNGPHKPSVDTPIQVRLYDYYYNAKYMIHSHVYLENPTCGTLKCIPCGALEEFLEITYSMPQQGSVNFGVNLKGHGSLIIVDKVEEFKKFNYIARPSPEYQGE